VSLGQRIVLGLLGLLALWGALRQSNLNRLARQVGEDEAGQRRFLATLASASQDNQPLPPDPKGDTLDWLSKNVFKGGLDRKILTNSPTSGGAGAEVKLRNLEPKQVLFLLEKMTRVNLIVRRLMLSDLGSRSVWEVHMIVETPRQEEKP